MDAYFDRWALSPAARAAVACGMGGVALTVTGTAGVMGISVLRVAAAASWNAKRCMSDPMFSRVVWVLGARVDICSNVNNRWDLYEYSFLLGLISALGAIALSKICILQPVRDKPLQTTDASRLFGFYKNEIFPRIHAEVERRKEKYGFHHTPEALDALVNKWNLHLQMHVHHEIMRMEQPGATVQSLQQIIDEEAENLSYNGQYRLRGG